MKNNKRLFSIVFTFLFIAFASLSSITVKAAVKKTIIPEVQFTNAPVIEYTAGDRVQFNIASPNFGGKVEYRVVLWDDSKKSYRDLWNETNGYPNRYYTKWQPSGNTIFTLGWPIFEPGNYRITVYVKRVGVVSGNAALKGMNCDSYKQSVAFSVKPKVTLFDKESQVYGSMDADKFEVYKGDTKITAKDVVLSNAKINGDLYISGDNAVIRNVYVTGKIVADPGKDGSTTLEDVTAKSIEVLSGGENSIHIRNVQAETMNVSSSSPVRVEADGDTEIVSTSASGYVIFDRKNGTYGTITISQGSSGEPVIEFRGDIKDDVQVETAATIKTGDNSKISNLVINTEKVTDTVKLEGQYERVEVAKEAKVEIGQMAVIADSLKVSAKAEIKADEKAVVQKVDIATVTNDTVKLEGTFAKVEINSQAKVEVGANTKIENIVANTNAEINLDKTAVVNNVDKGSSNIVIGGEGIVGTGNTASPSTGGAGGGYTPQTMSITGISVTSATSITFNSSVAEATIKWNGTLLAIKTVSGTNTVTVPSMTSGAKNTLVIEKSGYATFSKNDVVWTAPATKGTIGLSDTLNGGVNTTYTIDGYHMTFNGEVKYYQAEEDGASIEGNWVGVKITAPEGITPGDETTVTINNGEPMVGWGNIREEPDKYNYFYLFIKVRDITRTYNIEMKWNNEVKETFLVDFASTTTLELFKADLGNMIDGARYNYDNAANYGAISDTAVQAFNDAINAAHEVYDNAVNAKTEAVQAGIYTAQDELIAAQDAFFDAYNTTVEAVSNNMAANAIYTDADPLIITLSLKNGIGDFVTENTDYISLGGDLTQMTIKSVSFEGDPATIVALELTGTLGDTLDNAAISIAEGGINGHKHGFDAVWAAVSDVTTIGIKAGHESEVLNIKNDADMKRVTVMYPLTINGLKSAIESTDGSTQTYEVTDSQGNVKGDEEELAQDDNLIVTSQDGNESETYTIRVFGSVTIKAVQDDGITPVQVATVSFFNENNDPVYFVGENGEPITEIGLDENGEGTFFFNAADYRCMVKAEGYDTQEQSFNFTLDQSPLTVTVTLSPLDITAITIRVKDGDECQQKVNFIENNGDSKYAIIEYPATVGEVIGAIESTNGSAQAYEIKDTGGISKANEELVADGDIFAVTAADGTTTGTYIMYVYDTMTFTVNNGTDPIEGAVINVYENGAPFDFSYGNGDPVYDKTTDADGKYIFNVPCNGDTFTYRITVSGYEPQEGSFTPGQPDSDNVMIVFQQ